MLFMRSHLDAHTAKEGPQRQHLNSASLAGTNSAAHRGDSLEVAAQDQCSSVTVCKQQESSPLLFALLTGNPSDSKSCTAQSSSSKGINGKIKLGTNFSGQRNCKGQQVTGSLVAQNCGQTRTQHLDNSGGTPSTPHQQQVYFPPLNSQPSTDKVLTVGTMEPPTDAEIHDFIAKELAYFRTILTQKNIKHGPSNREWDRESTLQSDCIMPKVDSVAHLPTTSDERDVERRRLNCAVIEGCTAAVGQALEEDNSKGSKANADLTAMFKKMGDCPTSESENHSTGILFSAEEHSKHARKNESIEKSASVDFDLSLKNHLDVTRPANSICKLVYSDDCGDKTFVRSNDKSFHSKWCDKYIQNGMATVHYSLTALNELISSLEKVETIAETENISKVILQRYWNGNIDNVHLFVSTEYPLIMMKVAAACTKNEDNSPGVLTAVPGMTWDDLTEKQPSLRLNHSSPWLNINKNLDDTDHVPVVSWALNHMTEREKALKTAEGLHCVQGMTDVSEDLQTKTSSAVSENKRHASLIENQDAILKKRNCSEITHSKLNSSVGKIQVHNVISIPTNQSEWLSSQTSCDSATEDVASAHSQKASSMAFPENKFKKHAHPLCESKVGEACRIYEDISDEEVLQLATELPNRKDRGIRSPTRLEAIQYEDISDAESQNGYIADATSSPTQGPEPNDGQSPFGSGGYGRVQGQALKTEIISFDKLIPNDSPRTEPLDLAQHCSCVVETDGLEDVLCPKCNCERQTNHSVSCTNDEYETDDEMDDDYFVIPISMLGIQFEPEDEDQDSPETIVPEGGETEDQESWRDTSPTYCWSPPKLAAAFPLVPVFDTQECFLQAVQCENVFEVALGMSTPEHDVDSEVEAQTPQNRRGSVDSCETENSCDYSSASERNYLTASRKMLKKRSARLPSETDVSSTEEDSEGNAVTDMQKGQTRSEDKLRCVQKPSQLLEPKAGCSKHIKLETSRPLEISKKDDVMIISDTEDESDQKCKKRAKRKRKTEKRLFSSDSEDSGDASCSHQKRHLAERVKEQFQSNKLSSAFSPAPQHQSKHEAPFKEVKQDACSDQSHDAEKSGQPIQTKATSEQPKTNRPKTSEKKAVIIISSNSEDDDDPNYKTPSRNRFSSSGSDDGNAPCVDPESDNGDHGTAKEKLQVLQKADTKGMLSSGSEHSGDDLFAAKNRSLTETVDSLCGTANAKPQQNRISSEDSPGKRSQSVDNEANSTWGPNPVIPRFVVVKPSQPNDSLRLLKEPRGHRQGKDRTRSPKTSTASSKKKDSCEKNKAHLYTNKKAKFLLPPNPTNGRPHATKNNLQANVPKPTMFSRQLSLPSQEGPPTTSVSLPSTSGQLSESRQSSASSKRLSPSGESSASSSLLISTPRQHLSSSKLQRSHSYNNPSALTHPPTKSPTIQSSALTRLRKEWKDAYVPTRRDRKTSQEDSKATNDSWREARPGAGPHDRAPRQRHSSHEPATRLMKKTMSDAKLRRKAIHRDAPKEKRHSVGEGYKWSEKSTKGSSRKGKKCRSPTLIFESKSQLDSGYC